MVARKIAIEFDAPVGDARRLAELIEIAAGLVDPDCQLWSTGFKVPSWETYKHLRINVDARK